MSLARIGQLARLAVGFRHFVRHPVTYQQAITEVKGRLARRHTNFLRVARSLVYDIPSSPYRRLLFWAGCEYGDLQKSVESHGIEMTLERLRDAGVYLTLEEFKSRVPICRRGLTCETQESDFDNPSLMGTRIEGNTSGSRGKSARVAYDWNFIAEEAANELLLYSAHGLVDTPTALWFPAPPGIAGIHNLLMNLKWGRAPEKWFSQVQPRGPDTSLQARLALQFLLWAGRTQGLAVPRTEFVQLSGAEPVVAWMATARGLHGGSIVRTFGSSAVRIARTAIALGTDLSGCTIFSGGEPLTERRRRFIESAGLNVFARYVTTETGLVAASCPQRSTADDMHLYSDRLALIQWDGGRKSSGSAAQPYLFTTLTAHAGKVLFNTELGDFGLLATKRCECLLGELGMDTHMSEVRSCDKVTIEGVTLLASELDAIIGGIVEAAGGAPDSFQFWESPDADGLNKLILAVSPEVPRLDERKLVAAILDGLHGNGPRTALASDFWRQAGTIHVIRARPQFSKGHKLLTRMTPPVANGKPAHV